MLGKYYFKGYISGIDVGKIISKTLIETGNNKYKQFHTNIFNAVRKSKNVHMIIKGGGNGKRIYYHKEEVIREIKDIIKLANEEMAAKIETSVSTRDIIMKYL